MGGRVEPSSVLTDPASARPFVEAWRALAGGLPGGSYFSTPDWVLGWWETIGRECEAQIAVWRGPGGEPDAVVPLVAARERVHPRVPWPLRSWSNLGSGAGAADHCGWPVVSRRRGDARAWLARRSSERALVLRDLDPAMRDLVPDGARRVGVSPCPRMPIPPEDEPLGGSAKFRKRLRYYARKLSGSGVGFRWIPPEEMDDRTLEVVFDLHERRQGERGAATSFVRSRAPFHRALIGRSGPGRGPAAVVAEAGEDSVGVLYGFLWNGAFAYYQSGWDPAWAGANLGTVLVAEAIRSAGRAGASVFDFLRGAETYKYRFGATDRVDETWLVPTRISGKILDLKYRTKARLRGAAGQEQGAGGEW